MNKKLNPNFSLKKLLLSALVAGPLAILPAPLWALPIADATNVTTSSTSITFSGVTNGGGGALNITAPDKSILTWQKFGFGTSPISQTDTITYLLPSPTASVLNNVAGGDASTISGAINSNGNVYLLNSAGIVIDKTAQINTGGFFASTVAEPSSFFANSGTLNFTGTATADVTVLSDGNVTAGQFASIQALGTGNKITLAGRSVLVEGANLYGNVTLQSASTGKVTLAQTSNSDSTSLGYRQYAGGTVNILQAAGKGGDLTIVSNGGTVSLAGAGVAATAPTITVNAAGGLAITPATTPALGLGGSGFAPNSTLPLTVTSPSILQTNGTATTIAVGTKAAIVAKTDPKGTITSYELTSAGSGYLDLLATSNANVSAGNITATITPAGFSTNVTGALSVNTAGSTSGGDVSQSGKGLTVTGAATFTTGTTTAAGNVSLSSSALSVLNLPLVGTVNVTSSTGFALGNARILPNATTGLTLKAEAGNITMSTGAKVAIVPVTGNLTPDAKLTASKGGITFDSTGDLKLSTLSVTTASTANLTSTGNVTVPSFSGKGLIVKTTGGSISTVALTGTELAATLTATGNITVGSVNTTGKIAIDSGGSLSLEQTAAGFMNAGGFDLKAVGDITTKNATVSLATSATDAKITSTTGSVTITGGFAGGGTITAANNISIGSSSTKASATTTTNLDGQFDRYRVKAADTITAAGLYAPNSTIVASATTTGVANAGAEFTIAKGFFTTNASGQANGLVITDVGAAYKPLTTGAAPVITFTADNAPTNSVVANTGLTLTATAGTVTTGPIVGTGTVSIVSDGDLTVPSITAPNVSLESKRGSIAQTAAITASGNTTLKAGTSVSLDFAGNDFNNVVLTSSPSGVTLRDANALTLANGTNAAGNVTITSGAGLTGFTTAGGAATITAPVPSNNVTVGLVTTLAGSVTEVKLTNLTTAVNSGYAPGVPIAATFSAPPTASIASFPIATAAAATAGGPGWRIGPVGSTGTQSGNGLQAVTLSQPMGNGYAPLSEVPLVINTTAFTTMPEAFGVVDANGQIASVKITKPGAGVVMNPALGITTHATAAPIAGVAATGNFVVNAAGTITSLSITDGGSGYIGSYVPRVGAPAATVTTPAVITPTPITTGAAILAAAATTVASGYITAPVIAATSTAPAFTTTLNATGGIATVTPLATGGVALGSASTDVIKVAGNLSLTSVGPRGLTSPATGAVVLAANYSELTTVANTVTVGGSVSLNTQGANATFGVPTGGFGAAPSVSAAAVGGTVGVDGTFTVIQNNSVNLGATTAKILNVQSAAGDITNSGKLYTTTSSDFTAGSLFEPRVITLNDATNVLGGLVSIINGKNVSVVGAPLVNVGKTGSNGVVSGAIYVENSGGVNLGVAGNGNLGVVSFKAGGNVVITDITNADGLTLENISNTGTTSTVGVTALGPITLGSGIKLAGGGLTTITSNGAAASIRDSAPGISIINNLTLSSGNDIAITNTGHSIGKVTMTSGLGYTPAGGAFVPSTNANITYQEGSTVNLGGVTINAGAAPAVSLSVTSLTGSIFQNLAPNAGAVVGNGPIVVPTVVGGTNTVSFSAPTGSVTLNRSSNNIAPAVALTALGNSTINQGVTVATGLTLGNVAVTAGTFGATSTSTVTNTITQVAGTTVRAFGDTTLSTDGKITLDNVGNNFGGLTIASNIAAAGTGAAVVLRENGTINLKDVKTGTAVTSTLTLTSETGSIISSPTTLFSKSIEVGGPTTLVSAANVALNTTDVVNNFNGQSITITAPGNVSIQDKNATTVIAGGTTIGGTLTVKNDSAGNGKIMDTAGALTVNGNVFLQTSDTGSINIGASTASMGAIQFRSGSVSIAENTTANLAAGSTAKFGVQISSNADIITSGLGGGSFSSTLQLNANGNITVSNPIYVAGGLTFRALGKVNLSALSLSGNLANTAPTNNGASSYVPPSP